MSKADSTCLLTRTGERLFLIEAMLRGRTVSSAELRTRLQVSSPTLKRDIALLRDELGAPIAYERYENGYRFTARWPGVAETLREQMRGLL